MCTRLLLLSVTLALCIAVPARAETVEDQRAPLLDGQFSQVAGSSAESPKSQGVAAYYKGLASFALKDHAAAVSALVQVAEQYADKPVGLRAAAVATLALSRQGDRENACQYIGIVLPLTESMSPIWRAWIEEAQRTSACP